MPRKAFIADLQKATEANIPGISNVTRGDDDGSIYAIYTTGSEVPIEIELMISDVGSYPIESSYMIFSRNTTLPDGVGGILGSIAESTFGMSMTLISVLKTVSEKLQRHLAMGNVDPTAKLDLDDDPMDLKIDPKGHETDSEDDFYGEFDHDDFNFGGFHNSDTATTATFKMTPEHAAKVGRRMRLDLRAVNFAGFNIGILVGMKPDSIQSIVSIAVQVIKLGLSEEAMQAWDLEPQQYIVLLIRYSNGYKTFDSIIEEGAKSLGVTFRIGVSNKYKPTTQEAIAAFTEVLKNTRSSQQEGGLDITQEPKLEAGFVNMFISSSLNELINTRFISLLKIRSSLGVGWDGAKSFFNDKQGRTDQNSDLPREYHLESTPTNTKLPTIVTSDHLKESYTGQISFPLIAIQFALRYLTRCTEFCLVCHDKIKEDFEALKPYVCEKPLCLYQYMNLGFGPSVEHEVLTQPYVVDLLVSFCYIAAMNQRIREYPVGMSLSVPEDLNLVTRDGPYSLQHDSQTASSLADGVLRPSEYTVKFDCVRHEVIFEDIKSSPVHNGDWVIVSNPTQQHFKVIDVSLFPTIRLSKTAVLRTSSTTAAELPLITSPDTPPSGTPQPPNFGIARLSIYNRNFDEMNDIAKGEKIVMLIETMPSVTEMRNYLLKQSRSSQPSLRSWNERISPAALGILRWIIASNRSCIVQVDRCPGQDDNELAMSKIRLDQRVSNISTDWVQFRFAQGSPDKEQRFLNALREQRSSLNLRYPTLFAFHGSPLQNWHSIIRSGLDFKETLHGRAFGNGVYHASDQTTSIGYAGANHAFWHASELKISSAMSLNEIVNCPQQYVSMRPYLVVSQTDWIQCRYLMVKARGADNTYHSEYPAAAAPTISRDPDASVEVEQDPAVQAKSTLQKVIGVPLCAATISMGFLETSSIEPSHKRRKSNLTSLRIPILQRVISDCEADEDRAFLLSDDEREQSPKSKKRMVKSSNEFIPGSLDQSKLPILKEPEYATSMATRALTRALKELLELQKNTPLHELGWYVDAELIDNVYQWIVELHSFDPNLPLSKDMQAAGVISIVMEIRFPSDYPFSPPFLRVIRPRFLPFTLGGGGHVTGGGAMCMELLTTSGWSAVSSIEGVLLQVRMAISNLEPKPARLENMGRKQTVQDYGVGEAMAAYLRACHSHGWKVPESFAELAGGAATGMF